MAKATLSDIAKVLKGNDGARDFHYYGTVVSEDTDEGTYEVAINSSSTSVTAAKLAGAKVGDTVMVTVMSNGYATVTGCLGGDKDAADAKKDAADAKEAVVSKTQSDWEETRDDKPAYINNKPAVRKGTTLWSVAEGHNTIAGGWTSHAEGESSFADGDYSHSSGLYTYAAGEAQTVVGRYNVEESDSLFIVGNGEGEGPREGATLSNAVSVKTNGDTYINGDLYLNNVKIDNSMSPLSYPQMTAEEGEDDGFAKLYREPDDYRHPEYPDKLAVKIAKYKPTGAIYPLNCGLGYKARNVHINRNDQEEVVTSTDGLQVSIGYPLVFYEGAITISQQAFEKGPLWMNDNGEFGIALSPGGGIEMDPDNAYGLKISDGIVNTIAWKVINDWLRPVISDIRSEIEDLRTSLETEIGKAEARVNDTINYYHPSGV